MFVRCIYNKLARIGCDSAVTRLRESIRLTGTDSSLSVGREYLVQAVEMMRGGIWLYIHAVNGSDYPYPYPIEFFGIVDSVLDEDWITFSDADGRSRTTFPEWASDGTFYERLVDEDSEAIKIYALKIQDLGSSLS